MWVATTVAAVFVGGPRLAMVPPHWLVGGSAAASSLREREREGFGSGCGDGGVQEKWVSACALCTGRTHWLFLIS